MTQPGETVEFSAYDHLRVLLQHTDPRIVNVCVVNTTPVPSEMIEKYREKGADLVRLDLEVIQEKGYEVVRGALLKVDGQVRHEPVALARLILNHHMKVSRSTV
jgi:2-phospho-L-lactate transferase/gluconeogenesis factor (CofD/UPF0052 family)